MTHRDFVQGGHRCPTCLKRIEQINYHRANNDIATMIQCDDCTNALRVANGFKPLGERDHSHYREQIPVPPDLLEARLAKYGLSIFRYEAMLKEQRGRCAICNTRPISIGDLVVDHNHESGKVRGLLCGKCNTALGMFRDSPDVLEAALQYLEERGCYGTDSLSEEPA